jgi:hypothetical protein
MKTRKNLFAVIAFCIILSVFTAATASARNLYIDNTTTALSISSSGTATVKGSAYGNQSSTDEVEIYLYLQQYKNGSWQTIESWSDSFESHRGNLSETYSLTKGYKYRAKAVYYAYGNSGGYDCITSYSSEQSYN